MNIDYSTIEAKVYFDSIIDVNGKEWKNITLSATIDEWANQALAGTEIECSVIGKEGETVTINAGKNCPSVNRAKILCVVEGVILEQYTMLPLHVGSSALLKGKQINYSIEKYVYGVEYGGIKYITYNYSDDIWERYIKSVGGNINYTN